MLMLETTQRDTVKQFVKIFKELSSAKDIEAVLQIVTTAAKELVAADGATFVVKEGNMCYYAEEDAIDALWKGCRLPIDECISGWAIVHDKVVSIEDIYVDDRILPIVYESTFIKSMLIVPVKTDGFLGAIGSYWPYSYQATEEEIVLLQDLADMAAIAIERVNTAAHLSVQLGERTALLEGLTYHNLQLEEFCYIISHNLRAPLHNLLMLNEMISESACMKEKTLLISKQRPVVDFLHETFEQLIEATQVRTDLSIEKQGIDIASSFLKTMNSLQGEILKSEAAITYDFTPIGTIHYPLQYFNSILMNLLSNSIKYRSLERKPKVHVKTYLKEGWIFLEVEDNGLGIDLQKNGKNLFKLRKIFHQHPDAKGFGLFITKTQIEALGGKIWAESAPNKGLKMIVQLCPTH